MAVIINTIQYVLPYSRPFLHVFTNRKDCSEPFITFADVTPTMVKTL